MERKTEETELKGLNRQELLALIEKLRRQYRIPNEDVSKWIPKGKEISIPLSIFIPSLGALECIVCYLKEQVHLSYHDIAVMLHRDDRTIWATYDHARKKEKRKLKVTGDDAFPVSIIQRRQWSVLENIVKYLKEEMQWTYHEIAEKIKRNEKTIWTVYARAQRKET